MQCSHLPNRGFIILAGSYYFAPRSHSREIIAGFCQPVPMMPSSGWKRAAGQPSQQYASRPPQLPCTLPGQWCLTTKRNNLSVSWLKREQMGLTDQRGFFSTLTDPMLGDFFREHMTVGSGSCLLFCLQSSAPTYSSSPMCSWGISPPSALLIQGELAARLGLKFPVNFLVLINLGAVSKVKEDHNTIHGELHNLEDESKGNGMKFKTTKCKVMHLGINKKFCSKLGAHQLEMREEQKDVSVLVNQRISTSHQWVVLWKSKGPSLFWVKHSQFRPVMVQWCPVCHGQDFTWVVLCMEEAVQPTGKKLENRQGNRKVVLGKDLNSSWFV